ncbi:hypothetical protein ACFLUH_01230 [Chloroflexota bacterium]
MSDNEVWATCGDCGTELKQSDKQCPECGSTKKAYSKEVSVKIGLSVSTRIKHKRKGMGTLIEMINNRWKRSINPTLKNGVREDMVIDREKNQYHHVVKDAKTGEIIHEEHEQLSKHVRKQRK